MTEGTRPSEFDPDLPGALADPDVLYEPLRRGNPVAWSSAYGGFWVATRYRDIERITTDPETFTTTQGIIVPRNPASGRRPPLHYDPPEHTVYRKAINPVFRKDRLGRMEPLIGRHATDLLAVLATGGVDTFDAYLQFCSPFASLVVCSLLNIDDAHAGPLHEGMDRFEAAQRTRDRAEVERLNLALYALCRELVDRRLADPLPAEEDLASGLLAVSDPPDVDMATGSLRQIVVAGHGAPALAIASAIAHLAADTELQDRWRVRPDELAAGAEELLRLHTPNVGFARTATRPTSLGGRSIAPGEMVAIVLPSANRDEEVFEHPDELMPGRPERHLAFGHGVHVCPGSVVGRAEVVGALAALLSMTERFSFAGPVTYSPWPTAGPTALPIEVAWRRQEDAGGGS